MTSRLSLLSTPHTELSRAEASRYAILLDWGTRFGMLALSISFAAYLFGWLQPHVPLDQLPSLWNLPLKDYLQRTGTPTGWSWLAMATTGDLSNLIGISLLTSCALPPLLGLIPLYLKRRDFVYAGICAAIIVVIVLAASGILAGGH